ncbi:MAG: enoyl-CoA hydratase/isomerase family protein [Dehalococcoidia bacterium]|nr:enoyl-CoA hydratase/isomerase family protein [Dehalococcoidia bacterium]
MDPVLFSIDERGVATITLNRPGRLNAINMAMRDLLWEYFRAGAEIEDVRVIVFRGEGGRSARGRTSPSSGRRRR